ncbi:MAG: aminoacyl-tRNA hydrolase [Algisphaera sp.]
MKLIVGLGNPGKEYENTRHNAGFLAAERLARRHNITGVKSKFHAAYLEGFIHQKKVLLMQPMTFMNRSGLSVGEAATFYKLAPEDILVLVDDLAFDCGQIRLRSTGSAGGHNGLKDIERVLGTRDYPRLRIGIDPRGRAPQVDYVLGRFSPDQRDRLDPGLDLACDCIERWLTDGIDKAMNRFNPKG